MSDTTSMDMSLNESSDGVDMTRPATVLSREHVYQGAIFGVEDMRIALPAGGGDCVTVRRQVCRHAPCVVMLVHDETRDLYLLEREYRVGSDLFAYGLPAGLMDDGEDVEQAALRELAEETDGAGSSGVAGRGFFSRCFSIWPTTRLSKVVTRMRGACGKGSSSRRA